MTEERTLTDSASISASDDEPVAAEMTPDQLAEAKEYGRTSLYCDLADKALDVGYLTVMTFALAVPLDAYFARFVEADTPRLLLIFVVTTLGHVAVSFPLSLFAGYSLEHRYRLSHLTLGGWLARYASAICWPWRLDW